MDKSNYPGKEQPPVNAPMEQVREILFGAQLKDMEVRFKRQEDRLLREISDVKDSLKKRLDSLENFMKSEISSLLERLKRESEEREAAQKDEQRERQEAILKEQRERADDIQKEQRERAEALKNEQRERQEASKAEERERQEAVNRLNTDLANTVETFERKLSKLADTIDSAERELRSLLVTESGSLTDKIESKYADALSVIAKTSSQIRADMVYRAALSGIFAEMVGCMSKPWNEELLVVDALEDSGYEQGEDYDRQPENDGNNDQEYVAQLGSADNY